MPGALIPTIGALVRAAHRQHVYHWRNHPTAWGEPATVTELRKPIIVPAAPRVDAYGRPLPDAEDVLP